MQYKSHRQQKIKKKNQTSTHHTKKKELLLNLIQENSSKVRDGGRWSLNLTAKLAVDKINAYEGEISIATILAHDIWRLETEFDKWCFSFTRGSNKLFY
ncbi:unnamed protein product [Coffea canephora]|uniref:Uncharacterized protein n=1 Tax=Coffea canephora TaxID=49390 RepID=A0A068UAF2_COFCA|nr:unnamed protein product [Coffea canephora]